MNSLRPICQLTVAAAAVCLWFVPDRPASATLVASDSASNAPYDDGWESGENGGFGFGAWDIETFDDGVYRMFSSTNNGDGDDNADGDIDTAGRAFGIAADSQDLALALRPLNVPLSVGQTFSLDMDHGPLSDPDDDPLAGFYLLDNNLVIRFEFAFNDGLGNFDYYVRDGGGFFTGSTPANDEGLSISVTLTGADTYSMMAQRIDGTPIMSLSDRPFEMGDEITHFALFSNAGLAAENEVFFNNFAVTAVPEPAWLGGLGIVLAALVGWMGTAARRWAWLGGENGQESTRR